MKARMIGLRHNRLVAERGLCGLSYLLKTYIIMRF